VINEGRLLKHLTCIIAFVMMTAVWSGEAQAVHRGTNASIAAGPVLQNVAVNYGVLTPSGLGSVRLSSQDLNYGTGLNPSGLDVLVSGGCAKWSETFVSGRSSTDFNLIPAHTVEGTSAKTPNISSTGVGHMTGAYVFNIVCEDSSGTPLATKTLTYNSATNAVNIGTGDRNFSNWPSGFGNVAGAKVLFSTGFVHDSGRIFYTAAFSQQVIWTWADTSRPGAEIQLEFASGSGNVLVKDMSFTGSSVAGIGSLLTLAGTGGPMSADNVHGYLSQAIIGNSQTAFVSPGGVSGTVNNFSCEWCATGAAVGSNYIMTNGYFRYVNNNGLFFVSLHDTEIDDVTVASLVTNALNQHPDCMQRADGSSQIRLVVKRFMCIGADATSTAQGPWFGGAVLGSNGGIQGYISAGCGNTNPGKNLCITSGGLLTGSAGSVIYSPSGSPVGASDLVTIGNCGSNCLGQTSVALNLASDINYGSAGAPATFYGLQTVDNTFDMIAYAANTFNGLVSGSEAGTSTVSRFTYIEQDYPGAGAAGVGFTLGNCEVTQVHLGTFSLSGGIIYEGIGTRKANPITPATPCSPNVPPANTTVSNVTSASGNTTTLNAAFAGGNPQPILEAVLPATYKGETVAQLKHYYCGVLAAKVAGPLDGGGGTWYNAFNSSGNWADGTAC